MTQDTINKWYDEGQKPYHIKTEPAPDENKWSRFLIYGKKLNPSLIEKILKHD